MENTKQFGPKVKVEKLDEMRALFQKARPVPAGMSVDAWINQVLGQYLASILETGMLVAVQEQGLMNAAPYMDTDYASYD